MPVSPAESLRRDVDRRAGEHQEHRRFATTRWSLVLEARGARTPPVQLALEELCRAYWMPVFAFVLRQVRHTHDAQDLTQAFFVRLLEHDALQDVHPDRGRFRSFLLASIRNFLNNERDRARTIKRGGHVEIMSLSELADSTALQELADSEEPPDAAFDRRWALSLLDRVMQRMTDSVAGTERATIFRELSGHLTAGETDESLMAIATTLKMTVNNVRVTLHRLRRQFRMVLRDEVAQTIDSRDSVDDEIRHLFAVLQRPTALNPRTQTHSS